MGSKPVPANWFWRPIVGEDMDVSLGGLILSGGKRTTKNDIALLRLFPELKYVALSGNEVDDESIRVLEKLPNLQTLYLDATSLTDVGLQSVESRRCLVVLSLSHSDRSQEPSKLTPKGITECVTRLPSLTNLDLSGLPLDEHAIGQICLHCARLEHVTFHNVKMTDDALCHLKHLKNLATIRLTENPGITDKGLEELSQLTQLQGLDLHGSGVTPEALEKYVVRMPNLRFSDPVLEMLGNVPENNDPFGR